MTFVKRLVSRAVSVIDTVRQVATRVVGAVRSALGAAARPVGQACSAVAAVVLVAKFAVVGAFAQSDIASSLTELNTYWTDAVAIGVLVLLWVVGRMLVHRGTRG